MLSGTDIYNVDESGLSSVNRGSKIIAPKGSKTVFTPALLGAYKCNVCHGPSSKNRCLEVTTACGHASTA
jgi:hypothetical protein